MDHPPYSPDLAPSDFWLFVYIRERLTSNPDGKGLMKQITGIVNSIPKEEYEKKIHDWTYAYKITETIYFEHLIK